MGQRQIRYAVPNQGAWKVLVPEDVSRETIYKAIEWFSSAYQLAHLSPTEDKIASINLAEIINLHNLEGVSHLRVIRELITKIKRGVNIMNLANGAPNVHLARVDSSWVAINGHHTLIAYMLSGTTQIAQLPYLIVENVKTGNISPQELVAVFNEYADQVSPDHWQDKTLNWSAPEGQRLTDRVQQNMGELFVAFIARYGPQFGL